MSGARVVREDQHGTTTGYAYGCRCFHCRSAYRASPHRASADVLARVYAALEREADLDGIVTASSDRIGELAGVSQTHAAAAINQLASDGRLAVARRRTLTVDLGWNDVANTSPGG